MRADDGGLEAALEWANPKWCSEQKTMLGRRVEADQNHLLTQMAGTVRSSLARPPARPQQTAEHSRPQMGEAGGSKHPGDAPGSQTELGTQHSGLSRGIPLASGNPTWKRGSSVQTCPCHPKQVAAEHPSQSTR